MTRVRNSFGSFRLSTGDERDRLPVDTGPIAHRIFLIRGHNVMLSPDLAELYTVQAKALNQAVKRNRDRFPVDFMFQLTKEEFVGAASAVLHPTPLPRKASPCSPQCCTALVPSRSTSLSCAHSCNSGSS